MGTKLDPGKYDCYENALPDEPMFVLLARDPHFHHLVNEWVYLREQDIHAGRRPESDLAMIHEARVCAQSALVWRDQNNGKWRK